jgi:hypothetical protein
MLLALVASLFLDAEVFRLPFSRPRLFHPDTVDEEWLQFNISDAPDAAPSGQSVRRIRRLWRTQIDGASDSSPAYVRDVPTADGPRDLLILTTMTGRTIALDARRGTLVWATDPPPGPQWTTSSPAIDPNRRFVYSYALDGYVHKYRIGSGVEIVNSAWPQLITRKPQVEKGSSALSIVTTNAGAHYLYMTTAGYPLPEPGDGGDYQGHIVAINLDNGKQMVFNSACSDLAVHFVENGDDTNDCANVQSGIWARAGVVYDPVTDRVFVTTGNGVFDGKANWGSSVIALRPDVSTDGGMPVDSYTPSNYQILTAIDADLGSTTVAILPQTGADASPRIALQGGKDDRIRFIDLKNMSGQSEPGHTGGELANVPTPQGGPMFTRPVTWIDALGRTWVFITNGHGVTGSIVKSSEGGPSLDVQWSRAEAGGNSVLVNGVLYVPNDHHITAIDPLTGETLWEDTSIGSIHWQSPIIVNDHVFIADSEGGVTAFGY